jgi:hypothetical protein
MRGGIVCAALLLSLAGGLSEGIDLGADFAHSADDNVDIEALMTNTNSPTSEPTAIPTAAATPAPTLAVTEPASMQHSPGTVMPTECMGGYITDFSLVTDCVTIYGFLAIENANDEDLAHLVKCVFTPTHIIMLARVKMD